MPKSDHVAALKRVPLFEGLSDRELRSIAADVREEPYSAGQNIVTEGSVGGAFFIITEGRAKIIQGGSEMRTIGPGAYFGEMALFDRSPRAATVKTETQVKTLALSPASFATVLSENWSVTQKILAGLAAKIRQLDGQVV